ncbi:MAG: hypothetical protein AAFV69_00665 [Pseudomonadota bacterium]
MTKRLLLGFGTILTGWCLVTFAIVSLTSLEWTSSVLSTLAVAVVFASVIGWLWSSAVRAQAAEAPHTADGDFGQARNHGVALLVVGILAGIIVTTITVLVVSNPVTALSTTLIIGVIVSGIAAPAWRYNCAPEWLDG